MCGRRPLDCPVLPVPCTLFAFSGPSDWPGEQGCVVYIYTLGEPSSSTPSHMPVADLSDPLDLATILGTRQCYFVSQVPWLPRICVQYVFTQYLFVAVFVLRVHTDSWG